MKRKLTFLGIVTTSLIALSSINSYANLKTSSVCNPIVPKGSKIIHLSYRQPLTNNYVKNGFDVKKGDEIIIDLSPYSDDGKGTVKQVNGDLSFSVTNTDSSFFGLITNNNTNLPSFSNLKKGNTTISYQSVPGQESGNDQEYVRPALCMNILKGTAHIKFTKFN